MQNLPTDSVLTAGRAAPFGLSEPLLPIYPPRPAVIVHRIPRRNDGFSHAGPIRHQHPSPRSRPYFLLNFSDQRDLYPFGSCWRTQGKCEIQRDLAKQVSADIPRRVTR
jgi:hypothetical protein